MQNATLASLLQQHSFTTTDYRPLILSARHDADRATLLKLLQEPRVTVSDALSSQLGELIRTRYPRVRFSRETLDQAIAAHLSDDDPIHYGVWVYYSWSNRLVHTLPESEFSRVRTNRNCYKITPADQQALAGKRIGVIGLSVGQAVALTLAMERDCKELRLADFDLLELSNLNRVRAGIHQLNIPKVLVAAREIAEIDPFLDVSCFTVGITEENIDQFLFEGGKLDLIIEECDSLNIKILVRQKARLFGIPVLMATSDRGMLDVERFDVEPHRSILHGLIDHLDTTSLRNLTTEEKIPYVLAMLGIDTVSRQNKASMLEIDQTINTWPQLASSVAMGGAIASDVARRILTDKFQQSGRYFVDIDTLIDDRAATRAPPNEPPTPNPAPALDRRDMAKAIEGLALPYAADRIRPNPDVVKHLVEMATLAPSGGNAQPWQWLYQDGTLYLFQNPSKSLLLDFMDAGAYMAFGAATENLLLAARALQLPVRLHDFIPSPHRLVAAFNFYETGSAVAPCAADECDALVRYIKDRTTNRNLGQRASISADLMQQLQQVCKTVTGAALTFITSDSDLAEFGHIAGRVDRLRLFNQQGHRDLMQEIRWTQAEAHSRKDGIDLATIDLTRAEQAGLYLARDWSVVSDIKEWGGGGAFEKLTQKSIAAASCVGLLTMPHYSLKDFFVGGRALQRIWLTSTKLQLAFQPVSSATFLFARLLHGHGVGLDEQAIQELHDLRRRFVKLFPIVENPKGELLLFRLAITKPPKTRSLRYPVDQVLLMADGAPPAW